MPANAVQNKINDLLWFGETLVAGLACRGVDVLFRMHQRRKFDFRRGRRLGVEDHVVTWAKPGRPGWMDEETYARAPDELTVREPRVRVEQPGFRANELVLVTTLGGIAAFGLSGVVVGPVVGGLFLAGWSIYREERQLHPIGSESPPTEA